MHEVLRTWFLMPFSSSQIGGSCWLYQRVGSDRDRGSLRMKSDGQGSPHREAYAYLGPAVVSMLVLVFVPFILGIARIHAICIGWV